MRIAYISYEYPPDTAHGGIATYVAQAARMMAVRGHQVEVFAASPTRQETTASDGVVEHWLRNPEPASFPDAAGSAFAARHAAHPFDVLEGPDWRADARVAVSLVPSVAFVLKMHTPSVVLDQLNFSQRLKPRLRFALWHTAVFGPAPARKILSPVANYLRGRDDRNPSYRMEREHARRADIVAPPCHDLCAFAAEYWGIAAEAVRFASHPYCPAAEFLAIPTQPKGKVIGFVGRLERRKGIEVLAAAIPSILAADPAATVRLIGQVLQHASGVPYDKWLQRELGSFADRVEFVGKVPLHRMPDVYADLDICVFPSLWENFPNVCLEAMAAGRAIVAGNGGGMREMLDGGKCGIIVPAGNHTALAAAVRSLLRAPEERSRLGQLARDRVLSEYNTDVVGTRMEAVYQAAIERAAFRRAPNPPGGKPA